MGNSIASRRVAVLAVFAAAGIALFVAYLNQSWTTLVSSDGASNALQAWDMLHGNPTLNGWAVSDVSFYTTELPEYMVVEILRGLGPGVTHICGALTYTLVVLMTAVAARGRATGWPGAARALLAAGVLLAPQLGTATSTLLLSPDHTGTAVPLLLTFFVLDWGETLTPRRWYVAVIAGFLLAWTAIGDPLALVIGALPLAAICCLRAARRQHLRYELMLLGAAAFAVIAQSVVTRFMSGIGGWRISGVQTGVAGTDVIGRNFHFTVEGVLQLFGADFTARPQGLSAVFALLHLAGPLLLLGALAVALGRFFSAERLVQVLTLAIVINLVAYEFGVQVQNVHSAREIAEVLPFGAVLIGRLLGDRLGTAIAPLRHWRPALGIAAITALLASYSTMLGYAAAQPSVLPDNTALVAWLQAHHLHNGLGGYWQANSTTLDAGGKITVRATLMTSTGLFNGSGWEANSSWYISEKHFANFVVAVNFPLDESDLGLIWRIAGRIGHPSHTFRFGRYTVAVWRHTNVMYALSSPNHQPQPG